MPSKSDIQFGKLAVASHFSSKEDVEACLKDQARFERERHTSILEAFLLARKCVSFDQVDAIQKKMKRRVLFCEKCYGKFNVFEFRGGEKFLCHKCGTRVSVPEAGDYRSNLEAISKTAADFLAGKKEAGKPAPAAAKAAERDTIMVSAEDIEKARASKRKASAKEELPEPAGAPKGGAPAAEEGPEEVELEAEIEEEEEEEEEEENGEGKASGPGGAAPAAASAPDPDPEPPAAKEPAALEPEKRALRKIKVVKKPAAEVAEAVPAEEPQGSAPKPELKKKIKFEGKLKKKPKA